MKSCRSPFCALALGVDAASGLRSASENARDGVSPNMPAEFPLRRVLVDQMGVFWEATDDEDGANADGFPENAWKAEEGFTWVASVTSLQHQNDRVMTGRVPLTAMIVFVLCHAERGAIGLEGCAASPTEWAVGPTREVVGLTENDSGVRYTVRTHGN